MKEVGIGVGAAGALAGALYLGAAQYVDQQTNPEAVARHNATVASCAAVLGPQAVIATANKPQCLDFETDFKVTRQLDSSKTYILPATADFIKEQSWTNEVVSTGRQDVDGIIAKIALIVGGGTGGAYILSKGINRLDGRSLSTSR